MGGFSPIGGAPFGDNSLVTDGTPVVLPGHAPQTNQIAMVVPGHSVVEPYCNQIALVFPSADIAVVSVGAHFNQIAIVSVGSEYIAKPPVHGYLMRTPWAFPLLIQKGY